MNILITGAAGFIGGFLTKWALAEGAHVLGIGLTEPEDGLAGASFERCDVRDAEALSRLVAEFRPDRVFHLAAQSFPTVSLAQPRETMEINANGTINLFESLRAAGIAPVVVVACSSAEYGLVRAENLPVREDHPLRPLHPYGVSKVAQDLLALQYFANYQLPAIRVRIFNTTGPSKVGDVCSDLARRVVEIESGRRPPVLQAGNLTTRRALVDVRDMVAALWLAAEAGEPGEVYNVGGSQIYSVQEIIDAIRRQSGVEFAVEQDPRLMRACDEPVIAGDTTKFRLRTQWKPSIPLGQTLNDMLAWWRARLTGDAPIGSGS
ncbi:MAG: GDP-mannose 4,6-dehydratase [Bryobacterales bacterium]|nr:GDP-mannose 4,6-dehydratase [Bryobacterales bacterium]